MSFSLEPATVPPPSLEARLISALRIVSDGADSKVKNCGELEIGPCPDLVFA